jgi:hypothetical protein
MLVSMLRVTRSDHCWGAICGTISNLCVVHLPARKFCQNNAALTYLAEAYISGGQFCAHPSNPHTATPEFYDSKNRKP